MLTLRFVNFFFLSKLIIYAQSSQMPMFVLNWLKTNPSFYKMIDYRIKVMDTAKQKKEILILNSDMETNHIMIFLDE